VCAEEVMTSSSSTGPQLKCVVPRVGDRGETRGRGALIVIVVIAPVLVVVLAVGVALLLSRGARCRRMKGRSRSSGRWCSAAGGYRRSNQHRGGGAGPGSHLKLFK
jgi:hypothetical protein